MRLKSKQNVLKFFRENAQISKMTSETLQLNLTSSSKNEDKRPKRRPIDDDDDDDDHREQPHKKMKKPGGGADSKNKSDDQPTEFISSLFNHNPEAPNLHLTGDEAKTKEAVFSEKSLKEGGVHPYIAQTLTNLGMESLTLVQSLSLPLIASGFDCLIKSQTGSGKTLAYAIPMVQQLAAVVPKIQRSQGTYAMIICPTRELVVQSFDVFQKLCYHFKWLVPGMLIGGEKRKSEKARVRKGITILIATPGRLIDHITHTESLSLKNVQWLVMDECDRMLELGYKRDVQTVLNALNEQGQEGVKRQTLLLSATLTQGIEEMSAISLKHPKFIDAAVEPSETNQLESLKTLTAPSNLQQTFAIIPAKLRLVMLASFILWKNRFSRARKLLVFMSTQDMVDFHCELFDRCLNDQDHEDMDEDSEEEEHHLPLNEDAKKLFGNISLGKTKTPRRKRPAKTPLHLLKLHGSMEQKDRLQIVEKVKNSDDCVLFCTDVAARGLDLPQIDWIVQYNPPTSTADYVHRVGRTARIGAKGSSIIFVLPSEAYFIKELENNNMAMAELTADRVLEKLHMNAEPSRKTGRFPSTMEEAATDLQMNFENAVVKDEGLHEMASQSYTSYIRSYASYPKDIRHIFSFKALHLGHIAKSFALRDPPSHITGIGKGHWVKKEAQKKDNLRREQIVIKAQEKRINQKSLVISEFSSGFDGIDLDQGGNHGHGGKTKKSKKKAKK